MLEPPKALSTHLKNSNNLKDHTMDNQQETKRLETVNLIRILRDYTRRSQLNIKLITILF